MAGNTRDNLLLNTIAQAIAINIPATGINESKKVGIANMKHNCIDFNKNLNSLFPKICEPKLETESLPNIETLCVVIAIEILIIISKKDIKKIILSCSIFKFPFFILEIKFAFKVFAKK